MRMSRLPHTEQGSATQVEGPGSTAQSPAPGSAHAPGQAPGAQESRRRGALLRRLLAFADWTALIVSLMVLTAVSASTDVATLFWATLFSPVWILVVKLHGLYDKDHRRIRHSTLDELPALVSAC